MALKIFRIGVANARISELEAENLELTKTIEANSGPKVKGAKACPECKGEGLVECEACDGTGEVNEEAKSKAIAKQTEHTQLSADLVTAKQTIGTLETKIKTLESMNTDLTGKVAAAESKVDATVAAKLAQATAAIGAPAQPVVPATAATPQALTGMARVRAAAKADLEKAGYVAKRQ
jgi:chromosome segregation ATPase